MKSDAIVEWARATAVRVHAKQKYQGLPYFTAHVQPVVDILESAWPQCPPAVRAIGYLHDALEDAVDGELTVNDLILNTSPKIVRCVVLLTRPKGSRAETNEAFLTAISTNQTAALVKVADRLANVLAAPGTKFGVLYLKERSQFEILKPRGSTALTKPREKLWGMLEEAYEKL